MPIYGFVKKQQKHLQHFVNFNLFLLAKTIFRLPTSRKRVMSLYNAVNTLKYQYVAKVDLLFSKPSKVYDSVDIIEQKPIIQICNFHLALLSYFNNDLWSHKLIVLIVRFVFCSHGHSQRTVFSSSYR